MKARIENMILIIIAILIVAAYGVMLYVHDTRSEAAISTETEMTFGGQKGF